MVDSHKEVTQLDRIEKGQQEIIGQLARLEERLSSQASTIAAHTEQIHDLQQRTHNLEVTAARAEERVQGQFHRQEDFRDSIGKRWKIIGSVLLAVCTAVGAAIGAALGRLL